MGVIVAKPSREGPDRITVGLNGIPISTQIEQLNFSGSFTISVVGNTATIQLSGSGDPGSVMYSLNGGAPQMYTPLTSADGWLVNDQGVLLVV